jgi:hypothetical protein
MFKVYGIEPFGDVERKIPHVHSAWQEWNQGRYYLFSELQPAGICAGKGTESVR